MTMAVSSPAKRGSQQLRGPRPQRLKVSSSSRSGGAGPVIVYEHTPKVVHARPQEFMTVVQRLTGMAAPPAATSTHVNPATGEEEGGPLLLTLGAPMAAGMLLSTTPGFIFSPNTMRSIQELILTRN